MDDECRSARRIAEIGKGADFSEEERPALLEHAHGACAGCAIAKRDPEGGRNYELGMISLEFGGDASDDEPVILYVTEMRSDPPPAPDRMAELFRQTREAIARKKTQT